MKKRYTEEQIIKAIKQHEAGAKVDDICREMGISTGTFYNYRTINAGCPCSVCFVENQSNNMRLLELYCTELYCNQLSDFLSYLGH